MLSSNLESVWDEAIASMLLHEFADKQRPLKTNDLQNLALENATRIGDIMETVFLLVLYGDWQYGDEDGTKQSLDQKALDELYAKGRVSAEDLTEFTGVWQPAL